MDIGYHFLACGRNGIPMNIKLKDCKYTRKKVFKHDFFAATALYEKHDNHLEFPDKLVLKINRIHHFLGMPMQWLGKWIKQREINILKKLQPLDGICKLFDNFGPTGFMYKYIDGKSLDEKPETDKEFWDSLVKLVNNIHQKNIIYMDMNKRGNIIRSTDGKPWLIDFQISMLITPRKFLSKNVTEFIRQILIQSDLYHLYKHKRRLCPEALTEEERILSRRQNPFIQIHRRIANPYKIIRRWLMKKLYLSGILKSDENEQRSSENDPLRFVNKY